MSIKRDEICFCNLMVPNGWVIKGTERVGCATCKICGKMRFAGDRSNHAILNNLNERLERLEKVSLI